MRRLYPASAPSAPAAASQVTDPAAASQVTDPAAASQVTDPAVASEVADRGVTSEAAAPAVADREPGEWDVDALATAYAYPEEPGVSGRAWLRGNMVASLDGAAHHGGRSHPLSSAADMKIFGVLRGLADVVVVGAETVRQEGYGPPRARSVFAERRKALGQTPAPVIAVVTASLDLDFSAPLFAEPLAPTIVLTGAAHHADRAAAARAAGADVIVAGEGEGVDPDRAVQALADRGHTRLLTEGGPRLLGQFAASGDLDELCLTLAPVVTVGAAPRIMDGQLIEVPERFALTSVLEEAGFLFTRYRRI